MFTWIHFLYEKSSPYQNFVVRKSFPPYKAIIPKILRPPPLSKNPENVVPPAPSERRGRSYVVTKAIKHIVDNVFLLFDVKEIFID